MSAPIDGLPQVRRTELCDRPVLVVISGDLSPHPDFLIEYSFW
jgi:hypothetical protein